MKVVYVIDSVTNLTHKIDMLKNRFGDSILYVVKHNLVPLFKTYGYVPNAIYTNNLSKVIHTLLTKSEVEDIIVCYSSLALNNELLNKFISKILDKSKIVYVMPKYNAFENMCNSVYNVYVKSLFKLKDSLASPKLQFIPSVYVSELLTSHFANKLFELPEEYTTTMNIHDKTVSDSLKVKSKFNKFNLIPIIAALLITIGLILSLAFIGINYLVVIIFACLYILDIVLAIIFGCKKKFDSRFLN